ncbi:50S ribosomal protein L25 [Clostridium sp. DL1XJH146]
MEQVCCQKRDKNCHNSAKRVRREGKVPGVLYGKNIDTTLISFDRKDLSKEVQKDGEHAVFNLELNNNPHKVIIKEIQREPLKHEIVHIDVEEINQNTMIQTEVPIILKGEGAVLSKGGILQKEKDKVKIKCYPDEIPKSFEVDVSNMNIGAVYRVRDVEVGEEISFTSDLDTILFSVNYINNKIEEELEDEKSALNSLVKDELAYRKEEEEKAN